MIISPEECERTYGKHDYGLPSHRLPVYLHVTTAMPSHPPKLAPQQYWEIYYCKRCRFQHAEAVGFTPRSAHYARVMR